MSYYLYTVFLINQKTAFLTRYLRSLDSGLLAYRDDEEGGFSSLSLNFLFLNVMNRASGFQQNSSSIKILPKELIGETSCR